MWEDSFLIHKVELVANRYNVLLGNFFFLLFPWIATKDNFPLSRMSTLTARVNIVLCK